MAGRSASRSTSRRACRASRSSGCPTRPSRRRASGSAARSATPASPSRRGGSPSTSPRPSCARPGASLDLAIAIGILLGSEQVRAAGSPSRSSASWAGRRGPPGARDPADGRGARAPRVGRVVARPAVDEARLVGRHRRRRRGDAGRGGRGRPRSTAAPRAGGDAAGHDHRTRGGRADPRLPRPARRRTSRTSPRCAARRRRAARSRSRSPAGTDCC